ncbi:3-hydroxyacyl-CoA dehydrogenase [Photobacterium makurazakiensis]|uniref:3-hydroxyacyl-CoA dehydrogenase n=1 Tax=Photobacterium makurazakiensis TaxID=2910234 RepID=UPI003D0FB6BB
MSKLAMNTVAVIGAGAMGAGIAQVAAQSGYQVCLFDLAEGKAGQAKAQIEKALMRRVQKGRLEHSELEQTLARIQCSSRLAEVAGASVVIEAIIENLEVKQSLFRDLEAICRPECILASNTSSISITAIASALETPERVVGLHFFNPAPVMKLVEVIRGVATADDVAQRALEWARSCGKHAVLARSMPGFIVNRVARPFYAEGLRALEEQVASVADIDYLLRKAGGFNMGPFELMDLIGHDVNYAVTKSVFDACYQDRRYQPSLIQKELVDAGFFGRKSGRGFYCYGEKSSTVEPNVYRELLTPVENVIQIGQWQPTEKTFEALTASTLMKGSSLLLKNTEQALNISMSAMLEIDGVLVIPTRGKSATQLADELGCPVVVFDYCQDYQSSPLIAVSAALQNTIQQTEKAIAYIQSLEKQVILFKDYPGMVVWRTLSMLTNEALDLVNKGGASLDDVDMAMKSGVNYPLGPIEWGRELGWQNLKETLEYLTQFYGEERYRPSPLLRQLAYGNE